MAGIKSFVLGFGLSFCSVMLYGHLQNCSHPAPVNSVAKPFDINLYKKTSKSFQIASSSHLFATVKKQSLTTPTDVSQITFEQSPDGPEDDEILSINLDENIPMEITFSSDIINQADTASDSSEEKSAMLPTDLTLTENDTSNSPWLVAKGSPNIKNKRLLEQLSQANAEQNLLDTPQLADADLSYKVAEKIKQSIIFPIPDEILNDEDLTPTFISPSHKQKKATDTSAKKKSPSVIKAPSPSDKPEIIKETKSTDKVTPKATENKGIIDSISSWFVNKPAATNSNIETHPLTRKKSAPSYSSQEASVAEPVKQDTPENLADFYESLQKTKKEHVERKIIPSELKLSFQPNRAEISGSTLRWLKIFSEATTDSSTRLQIRLDASASTDLQKKRLGLLYTIFMNNGVDFSKIDTVFSQTEPNTFIIRTLKD